MDPQQRLALETAERTMASRWPERRLRSSPSDVGVFIGAMTHDFSDQLCVQQVRGHWLMLFG